MRAVISLGVGMHTSALSLDQVESLSKVLQDPIRSYAIKEKKEANAFVVSSDRSCLLAKSYT